MEKLGFNFDEDSFNRLFPFYILIDSDLKIKGFGKSLAKTLPLIKLHDDFSRSFSIKRPHIETPTFEDLVALFNQLIVIQTTSEDIDLRGQFQEHNGSVLFVGSPWFVSMDQVRERKLRMHDFAFHDPLLDLLHVLKTQEITSQELKELLIKINNQKKALKKDQEELNRLALVASANKNGVVFTKPNGEIFWCNDAYLKLTGFNKEDIMGKTPIVVGKCEGTTEAELDEMRAPFESGQAFELEHLHRRKDGSNFLVKSTGQPILDKEGRVVQYFAMIEDVTEKKTADFKRIESENRLSFLIVNLQTGVVLEDENRKILLVNKKYCSMFDFEDDPDSLVGRDFSNAVQDSKRFFKNPNVYVERLNSIFKQNVAVYNEELELVDGRVFERSYIPVFRDGVYKGNLRSYVDITIKKKLEETLRNEKEKYSSIIANMNLGLIELDQEGRITLVNSSFCDISGYTLEELTGTKVSSLLFTEESKQLITKKDVLRKNGVSDSYEIQIENKKGELRHWLISGAPNYDINGEVIGSIGIHLDITEQKEQEEKLYLLSLIAEKNINGVVICNAERFIEWTNPSFEKMSGYTKEELVGKKPGRLLQGSESNQETIAYLRTQIRKGQPFNCEIINYSKNGEKYWAQIRGQALFNKEGKIVRFFAVQEDITLKKKLEETLQNEKEKYRNIIANMNLGLVEVDQNERIILANSSFCNISGYSLEELIGTKIFSLPFSEESKQLITERSVLRDKGVGVSDSYEIQIKNKKGEERHWLSSGATNYDVRGKITGSIGVHLDITEQKEQEEKLYLLSLIAEKNINGVVICDAEGKTEWVNSSFEKMLGYTKEELVGRKPGFLLQGPETNIETAAYLSNQIRKGQPFNCEIINYSKAGAPYWVHIQGQALYNKNGKVVRFFAIEEDISKRKLLEAEKEELAKSLAKTNRELEDYAQIVSHDLKSPLRSIHSLLSWIKEDNDEAFNDHTSKYFSLIENKVEKMDHLIEGILTYSKIDKEDLVKESVDVQQIVESIIGIIHIPEHITVTIKNSLPIIKADSYRIQQLFQNIIVNAVNYIEREEGLVEIASKEFNDYFIFSIKDNGVGIAKEHYNKIFNTFQSYTKSDLSTGLGLAIVKKVVDAYSGEVWIESELGQGSTFFIKLNK
jgi:PAS domain S-box-containing protein